MSTRINTNVEALNAQRNLGVAARRYASSVEKLSSGLRINRAADDAAGLAISEKLQAQVTGLNQAQRNAQDGVSMVQTAEGALTEVHSMLQRIRELAVEAGNSTLGRSDAQSVNAEITALQAEITRIANTTTFNGQKLLSGALSVGQNGGTVGAGYIVQSGTNTAVTNVTVAGARASTTYTLSSSGGVGTLTLSDGVGNSQQINVGTLGIMGSETLNFGNMGVAITVASVAGETGANISAGLASGPGGPVIGIGGTTGSDLVNGDIIREADTTPTLVTGMVGSDVSAVPAPTTVASSGVAAGSTAMTIDPLWFITASLGGETFTGRLAPYNPDNSEHVLLTGDRGNTITLNYKQAATAVDLDAEAACFASARIVVNAGPGSAAVSEMTATGASVGTHAFSFGGVDMVALGGTPAPTYFIADMAPGETRTFDFFTISFKLTAGVNGMSGMAIVNNFLQPANDTIVVTSSSGGAAGTLITGAGTNATFQIGANQNETLGVGFADSRTSALGGLDAAISTFSSAAGGTGSITAAAGALITAADNAISLVSAQRAQFGAVENRLNHTVASLSVASENLNASQSRIRDLDVAAEMVAFTKNQILQQAGTSILAQANSAPQNILALLR